MKSFIATVVTFALVRSSVAFEECKQQARFDIMMCESHMCTKCDLAWCSESCQKVQLDFPGCTCENWDAGRASYSGGEFQGKGKFGDVGDYSKGNTGAPGDA